MNKSLNDDNSDYIGISGQRSVRHWLRGKGLSINETGRWAPFDLYTSRGTTIEVKVGEPYKKGRCLGWGFNIVRHGKMCAENCIDFYIFRLEPGAQLRHLGIEKAFHLIRPAAEVKKKFVWISLRSVIVRYGDSVNRVQPIKAMDTTKTTRNLAEAVVRSRRHSSVSSRRRKLLGLSENEVAEVEREERKILAAASARKRLLDRITKGAVSPAELEA